MKRIVFAFLCVLGLNSSMFAVSAPSQVEIKVPAVVYVSGIPNQGKMYFNHNNFKVNAPANTKLSFYINNDKILDSIEGNGSDNEICYFDKVIPDGKYIVRIESKLNDIASAPVTFTLIVDNINPIVNIKTIVNIKNEGSDSLMAFSSIGKIEVAVKEEYIKSVGYTIKKEILDDLYKNNGNFEDLYKSGGVKKLGAVENFVIDLKKENIKPTEKNEVYCLYMIAEDLAGNIYFKRAPFKIVDKPAKINIVESRESPTYENDYLSDGSITIKNIKNIEIQGVIESELIEFGKFEAALKMSGKIIPMETQIYRDKDKSFISMRPKAENDLDVNDGTYKGEIEVKDIVGNVSLTPLKIVIKND